MIFGYFSLFFVFSLGIILCARWSKFLNIFLIAFFIRIIFIIYSNYAGDLYDGTADAKKYETYAWEFSKIGFKNLVSHYPGAGGYFLTWPIAILYSIFGRSLMLAQSLSLFFGLSTVFMAWFIAKKLWGDKISMRVGWIAALHPSLVLYSCLVMRESYVQFFLILALFGVLNWSRYGGVKYFILAVVGFLIGTHFHGAIFVGLFVFVALAGLSSFKKIFNSLKRGTLNLNSLILILLLIASSSYFVSNRVDIPKLGNINTILDFSRIIKLTSNSRGDASYPEWVEINEPVELIYKTPVRTLYFLISPLPWDVKKPSHLLGLFDGLFYLFLLVLIIKNRKLIMKDPGLRNISIILLSFFVIFSWGVGNFGTGLRHRAKFLAVILLLAAPLIPKLSFHMKKINKHNDN